MTATHVWEILIDSYLRVIGERVLIRTNSDL